MWKGEAGVDIGRSINYVFQDPEWIKKVLIGGLLSIIPIVNLISVGYAMRTTRRIAMGTEVPLPEWDDFGGDLVRGLKLLVVIFVWMLPLWVLICVSLGITGLIGNDLGFRLASPFFCLVFLFSVALGLIYPLLIGRVAQSEQISDGLDFGAVLADARRYPKELLIILVVYLTVSFVAGFGVILCGIGVFFTSFIAFLIYAHLIGQIRRIAGDAGPAVPPPPPAGAPTY
jgi:hypothetical protein